MKKLDPFISSTRKTHGFHPSPGILGFYSTWWPSRLRQASIRGEKGTETRFFSFATTLAAKAHGDVSSNFSWSKWCEDFSEKESLEGKWGGNERRRIFFKYVILRQIWMCCLGVSEFFMISVFNSKLTTHPHFCDNSSGFFESSSSWGSTSPKRITDSSDSTSNPRLEITISVSRTPKDGVVCPVNLHLHGIHPPYHQMYGIFTHICLIFMVISVVVSIFLYFHLYLGKITILTNIFQMGWFNHQPVNVDNVGKYTSPMGATIFFLVKPLLALPLRRFCLPTRLTCRIGSARDGLAWCFSTRPGGKLFPRKIQHTPRAHPRQSH